MRISPRLVLAALVGVAFVALAGPGQAAWAGTGAATSTGSHVSRQDVTFLRAAHQGNLAEIAAGHVALAKSHDPEVRMIATHLIADHLKLDAGVQQVAAKHHVRLPSAPTRAQQAALAAVARKSGPAFDRAWLKLQEAAHLKTLALIDKELHKGCAADVKAVARTAKPVVKEHLEMVRAALRHR